MNYISYFIFGIMAAGAGWMLVSNLFATEMSRGVETAFDFIEYRLALRERGRLRTEQRRRELRAATTGRVSATAFVRKNSTQPLSIARIAA